tara:strand:+ start:11132 stop:11368 length:237 start_codon:yes stop_codon:yes gene_type:complete
MATLRVKNEPVGSATHKVINILAISLGILTTLTLFYSQMITSVTGHNVLGQLYGGAAPFVLILMIVMLIALYLKLVKN